MGLVWLWKDRPWGLIWKAESQVNNLKFTEAFRENR